MNLHVEPVAWMTGALAACTALIAADAALHILPKGWTPVLLAVEAAGTAFLGVMVRSKVTPLADPHAADGRELVPTPPARVPLGTTTAELDATRDEPPRTR